MNDQRSGWKTKRERLDKAREENVSRIRGNRLKPCWNGQEPKGGGAIKNCCLPTTLYPSNLQLFLLGPF